MTSISLSHRVRVIDRQTQCDLPVTGIYDDPSHATTDVFVALPERRPVAWRVTNDKGYKALFLDLARALEYASMYHGSLTELFE